MNDIQMKQLEQTLTSMEVAEMVEKTHANMLRDIKRYCKQMEQNNITGKIKIDVADFFRENTYKDEQGKERLCFDITKKGCEFIAHKLDGTKKIKGIIQILGDNKIVVTDYFIPSTYLSEQNKEMPCYKVTRMGCEFLANKFNGEKGIVFTARYVKRFHDMEQALKKPHPEIPEKDPFEHWEIRWKHETETWFSKNNWKLSIILERFGWTRKFLYHKILVELSDLHNLRAIEKAYYASYGYPPEYALDLLDFNRDLNDTATRYINYLLIEE